MPGSGKRNLYWIAFGWLLCGALHLLLFHKDFCACIVQCICGGYVLLWGNSFSKRVTDRRLRRLLIGVAVCLLLFLVLQLISYTQTAFFPVVERYLWYALYIPLLFLPVLCSGIALSVYRPPEEKLPPWQRMLSAAGALLILGVMTNDLHYFFKVSPDGIIVDNGRTHNGWLYYAVSAFAFSSFIYCCLVLLRKSRAHNGQRYRWLIIVPFAVGAVYYLLYPLGIDQHLLGKRVWQIGEMLVFCLTAALEGCIQAGMIPANTDYDKLFPLAELSAAIADGQGRLRYASGVEAYPFKDEKNIQIRYQAISGGRVAWKTDLTPLVQLNEAISENRQMLETRNAYLAEEARIRAERTELETRNAIYDRITRLVRPQLNQINALLNQPDEALEQTIRPITVMSTYIKRRSNMELLEKDGLLPLDELYMALLEQTDTLRLCGVRAACVSRARGNLPARVITAAYEQIESVIEDCFNTLSSLMISLESDAGGLLIRMLLQADAFTLRPHPAGEEAGFISFMTVTKDGQDVLVLFSYKRGGEGL